MPMLYLAPLQGYTDFIFREAFSKYFNGIDAYFIPYISTKNGIIPKKHIKEILPENNPLNNIVPQVLFKDSNELIALSSILTDLGYSEINLNLGCPYPMVTNRGKGSGLLSSPEKILQILSESLPELDVTVSVKLRSGLKSDDEIFQVIEVLNKFELSEIIYHPRLASQLYKGTVNDAIFNDVLKKTHHNLAFNGDIDTVDSFNLKQSLFPTVKNWMLGRGILKNPFLAEEINGIIISKTEKINRLEQFHSYLFNSYSNKLSGPGHILMKMKQFWEYFSYSFENQHKVNKIIKKTSGIKKYIISTNKIFCDELLKI